MLTILAFQPQGFWSSLPHLGHLCLPRACPWPSRRYTQDAQQPAGDTSGPRCASTTLVVTKFTQELYLKMASPDWLGGIHLARQPHSHTSC